MIVIDTHVLIFHFLNRERLSAAAVVAIDRGIAARSIRVPSISLWEVAMASAKKRVFLPVSLEAFLTDALASLQAEVVPISPQIAALAGTLSIHGDPADRIIAATAIHLGAPLVTADGLLRQSGLVSVVW